MEEFDYKELRYNVTIYRDPEGVTWKRQDNGFTYKFYKLKYGEYGEETFAGVMYKDDDSSYAKPGRTQLVGLIHEAFLEQLKETESKEAYSLSKTIEFQY